MPGPIFTIKRPTPTTVLYTISTRPAAQTYAARVQRVAVLLARINLGLLALLVLLQRLLQAFPSQIPSQILLASALIETTSPGRLLAALVANVPWQYLVPLSLATLWAVFRKGHTLESLLVIRGLGVQTSTSSATYLQSSSTRFIPTNVIQDIFIYEAFRGFEVKFYLAIVVESEEDVVVVFPNTLPKRQTLEEVWRGARACLYEPKT